MKWIVLYLTIFITFSSIRGCKNKRLLEVDELINSPFASKSYSGFWRTDTEIAYYDDSLEIRTLNVLTKESKALGSGTYLQSYQGLSEYITFSTDDRWVIVPHDCKKVYRHSRLCNTTIIDRVSGIHYQVAGGKDLQLVRMASEGDSFIYILDNDIYYQKSPLSPDAIRLTTNGVRGVIYNGICDWIYEEEVFAKARAFYFSTKGTKLVYLSLDDSDIKGIVHYAKYGVPGSLDFQYVQDKTIRYPKAGNPNPKASVHVIDLQTYTEIKINGLQAPVDLVTEDNIVVQMTWADDNNVVVAWTNRIQNIVVSIMCNTTTLLCHKILETRQCNGWIEYPTFYFKNASYFAIILPQPQGDAGTFQHLTVVSNNVQIPLTSGKRIVESIVEYDTKHSLIYYLATNLTNPESLHLYVISDDGTGTEKCLSCNICGTVEAEMSTNMSYYMLTCKGPGLGSVYVYSSAGTFIMELLNNTDIQKKRQELILPDIYNFEMNLADGISKASVRFYLPPCIDVNKKYPFLLQVKGDPDTMFNSDVYETPNVYYYLITAMEVIVAHIDVRGSARRGDTYKFASYKKLGGPDVEDYLYVTKELMKKYTYIDPQRTGISGIGYGGFIANMILGRDKENIFKCGISSFPFTNFIYCDSIWIEKYMGLPNDNLAGYNYTDVTQLYENFRGKKFLLLSATAAPFTLYQHSAALARMLQLNNVPFKFQSFIDESLPDDFFTTKGSALFYVHSVIRFLSDCFGVSPIVVNGTANGTDTKNK